MKARSLLAAIYVSRIEDTSATDNRHPDVMNAIMYELEGPITEDEVKNCLPSAGAGKDPLGMDGSMFISLGIPVITKCYNKILLAAAIPRSFFVAIPPSLPRRKSR
ncbi:unnamed protein product [Lepeophtheirus salmonis]|uniref:(salmon louse) hypothetical protein n=1 Tax=Lepeophtheirus salmonis TaxID=72036 RepID=A0A7R8D2W7_LEPSM|nr:unnamed protein product [Lepeophtheirus salmonis]CAF3007008.1 unnamed protein product [Lepeophtheirus salmonis]